MDKTKLLDLYTKEGFNDFEADLALYEATPAFKISDNVFDVKEDFSEGAHFIMRCLAEEKLKEIFDILKIDMTDANVGGDKGTPYRIIKTWTGASLDDDTEFMSGRWSKKPRIASFPNESIENFPITKRVDLVSVCSHHFAPFSSLFSKDAYALISYIPDSKVLGISKLQRLVDWISRRGHLQENLTEMIYNEISKAVGTKSVFVRLHGIKHTCETIRGSQSKDGSFHTEYYGGMFSNAEIRKQVKE